MLESQDEARRLLMLADLLEGLPTAVAYLSGPEHIFELANRAYRRLVNGRDVVGKPVRKALPEIEGQGYFELLDEVRSSGRPRAGREAEVQVRNAEGGLERIFVDFLYEPVRNGHGEVVGILVDAEDVTQHVRDRRRLEELAADLSEAEERYRTLFETMLLGVVYHDATGAIIAANPAAGEVLGADPADLVGLSPRSPNWKAVREDESPFPGDEHPAMVALRTDSVVTGTLMGVVHGRTGERRWLTVTAVPHARDEQGRPQRVYAMFDDVTEQRRAAASLRERDSLLGRLRDANVLGIVLADEQRVVDANDAFLEIIGYDREQLDRGLIEWRAVTPPEWAWADERALDELRSKGSCVPFEKEFVSASGERVPVLLGAAVVDREPLRWVTFVADLSDRQRAEQERARLVAAAQTAQAETAHAREQLGLLLKAGEALAATRDRAGLLRHLIGLLVPAVADFATVFVPTGDGSLRAVVSQHRDSVEVEPLERLTEQPLARDGSSVAQRAYLTRRTQLVRDVQALAQSRNGDAAVRELVPELGTDSAVAVPLSESGTATGVLTLGRTADHPSFSESDVAVAEELGRRLAAALTNADVIAREHSVAELLQRSLLPDVLPRMPGLDLAVVYLPTTEGVDVGGDWYDAFSLGEGRIGIVLGDVVGHNLASATTMNQVRNSLRAYAVDDPDPASVLARTNTALMRLLPEAMATVFYAVLDVPGRELQFASAGHPPPLLAEGGRSRFLDEMGGLMLGVDAETAFATTAISWPDEAALLLYSDGLIEDRRRPIDEGLAKLAAAFTGATVRSAEEVCATAQARLLATPEQEDDVCLLAIRLTDPGQPRGR